MIATHSATPIAIAPPALAGRRVTDLAWPLWLFIASMVVPAELAFEIGSLRISPQRLVLLLVAARIGLWLWRSPELRGHDLCILAAGLWAVGASFANLAPGAAIERGGAFLLETATAYLLPVACLGTLWQIRLGIRAFVPVVAVLAVLASFESLMGSHFVANAGAALMERPAPFVADERLGLLRARVTFAHQILFGVFCASLFALFWFEARSIGARVLRTTACLGGVFFSLSSAAFLLIALQVLLIGIERASRALRGRLAILAGATALLAVAIEVAVPGGIAGFVTRHLALNPGTGYYRQLIWLHVTDDIAANPLTGTGGPWTRLAWMVESIDHLYFAKAIQFGVPTIVLIAAGALIIGRRLVRRVDAGPDGLFRSLRLGWIFCICGIAVAGLTVDYFGRALPFVMFIIGLGAALDRAVEHRR